MTISRRTLLGSALALSTAATLRTVWGATPFFESRRLPIGLQLWTLGDALARDPEGTFREVAAIGYRSIEFAGFDGHGAKELSAALKRHGLRADSAHFSDEELTDRGGALLADARTLGLKYVVVSFLAIPERFRERIKAAHEDRASLLAMMAEFTVDDWRWQAERLNAHARAASKAGFGFAYHNHNLEFARFGDHTGFELLLEHTDPELVKIELDIGWAAATGLDPRAVLASCKGRCRLVHVKDLQAASPANTALRLDPIELGRGRLDWPVILPAAYAAGVRHFYVEQEAPFTQTRLEAARIDFEYLRNLGT